ncbi:unnamed protein product [Rhodiola kirilowii]
METEKSETGNLSSSGDGNQEKINNAVSMEHVLLALQETAEEREVRIRSLFNYFDSRNVGYLDHAQIEAGLSALRIPSKYKYAKDLLHVCDADQDGQVDYEEFRQYMDDKELELYSIFQGIDVEHNGSISPEELLDALNRAGVEIDDNELAHFVDRVDKDNNGVITFEEWRDFLFLYPHEATIENIYQHWERVCLVDIGEQAVIPTISSKHGDASKYLIAGGIAGAASRTATAPLDRLKVILQVQTSKASIIPAVKKIWTEGRFAGFFRGNGLNVVKVAPESALRFYSYELFKGLVADAQGEESKADIGASGRLFAGGAAGAVAQTFIYPLDLVKTRLQTSKCEGGKATGLGALSRDIWVHEGPRGFYRGLIPSVLGIIPYAGIDLAAYESLKEMSKKYVLKDNEPGPLVQLSCGIVSGTLGATCVYPLQVIRTRMQASNAYNGMGDVIRKTLQNEGFLGFYKGILPNMLKVVPSASITYMVYEYTKKRMELE